jgi:hypothetical protein
VRFKTEAVLATGDTPDELEADALRQWTERLGGSPDLGRLAIEGGYVIRWTGEIADIEDISLSGYAQRAKRSGHRLYALIACALPEQDEEEK